MELIITAKTDQGREAIYSFLKQAQNPILKRFTQLVVKKLEDEPLKISCFMGLTKGHSVEKTADRLESARLQIQSYWLGPKGATPDDYEVE